jgi:hypothetical protein
MRPGKPGLCRVHFPRLGGEVKDVEPQWVARPYRYADGMNWNEDRYEIFIWKNQDWVSIGGALKSRKRGVVAFLCDPAMNRILRSPDDVTKHTEGCYVWGGTLEESLRALKSKYPNPEAVLREIANF